MSCSSCGRDTQLKAKGLCGACHKRLRTKGTTDYYQSKRVGPCSACRRDIKIVAGGLCAACYQRKQKRGTTDYAPERVRGVCSVKGCGKPHRALGFCSLHYERLTRTGDPEETRRPDDWGAKTKHPLYHRWAHMMSHRASHPVEPRWHNFLQFVADIGEVKDRKAKMFAADENKPIGPSNIVWKHAISQRVEGEDERTFRNRRQRVNRRIHSEQFQSYDLKKNYGMSAAEKEAMLEAQGHKCAICRCDETLSIRGKRVGLAVDHCHSSGKVRGLLCYQCNTGLGSFKDNPGILQAALHYLVTA